MMDHYVLSEQEIRLIRILQEEFPVCTEPFRQIADTLGIEEAQVLSMTRRLQEELCLKRLAAVLYHTTVGYAINSMVAWDVPDGRVDETAAQVIRLPQLSHCYRRNREPGFPYNLYTMIHAKSEEDFTALVDQLADIIRPVSYVSLRTSRELKKTGMKYFMENTSSGLSEA